MFSRTKKAAPAAIKSAATTAAGICQRFTVPIEHASVYLASRLAAFSWAKPARRRLDQLRYDVAVPARVGRPVSACFNWIPGPVELVFL